MFGIKIISEERYQSEQNSAMKLMEINEELTQKNVRLELDIKSLREQNTKLRSINAKSGDENNSLKEKNSKLNEAIKGHEAFRRAVKLAFPQIDFKGFTPKPCNEKCSECSFADTGCKKYTDLSVCMIVNEPSFHDNK